MTRNRLLFCLLGALYLGACAPSAELVKASIDKARSARQAAHAAGASEKAPDLLNYTDDLIEQAEAADRRGNQKQALLAAELAAQKAEAARLTAVDTGATATEGTKP